MSDNKEFIMSNENIEKLTEDFSKFNVQDNDKTKKLTTKEIIDEVFDPNENGVSRWLSKEEIEKKNPKLSWGNNGVFRHGVFKGDNRYTWEKSPEKGKIEKIRTSGFSDDSLYGHKRPISSKIRSHYQNKPCVACGETNNCIVDHKNDLYNDTKVLNIETQTVEDFQSLCNSCNLKKRQICKKTKETGIRYSAKNIPCLAVFGIDFIVGDETFDENDINAMVGTYWYDPVEFMNHIKMSYDSK